MGTVGEMDFRDPSGHLGLNGNHLAGRHLAHLVEIDGYVPRHRFNDGHGSRRPFESGWRLVPAAREDCKAEKANREQTDPH
jgi:hypothetical protein